MTLRNHMRDHLTQWRDHIPAQWTEMLDGMNPDFEANARGLDINHDFPTGPAFPPLLRNHDVPSLFRTFREIEPAQVRVIVVGQDIYGRIVEMPTEVASASSDEAETTEDNAQLATVTEVSDEAETTEDNTQLAAVAQVSDEAEPTEDNAQPSAVAQVSDETETTEDDNQDSKNETNTLS